MRDASLRAYWLTVRGELYERANRLDSAIADEYLQLQRLSLQDEARDLLASFRQTLEGMESSPDRAA